MAGLARGVFAWFAVLALFLAPIIVNLTHSPASVIAAEAAVWHGHSHGDADDDFSSGHNATDHEHQVTGLVGSPGKLKVSTDEAREIAEVGVPFGRIRDGPRRPPRQI